MCTRAAIVAGHTAYGAFAILRQLDSNDLTVMPQAATQAEHSFRTNLSQFRWARGNIDDSAHDQSPLNPFSRFYNAIGGGYIPLRSSERSNEDEAFFALSRWERSVRPLKVKQLA